MSGITLTDLLAKAIAKEEEARQFYTDLAARVNDPLAQDTLRFLAGEEELHRQYLCDYRDGKKQMTALPLESPIDYRVAQHLDAPDIQKDLKSAEVYLVAAHREWASYNFYRGLADLQPEGEAKEMLKLMASQELRHKEKVEYLYSNTAFPQTDGG